MMKDMSGGRGGEGVKRRSVVGNDLKRIVTPTCPLHEQKC